MLTTRASAAGFPASKSASSFSDDTSEDPLLLAPHLRGGARRRIRMLVPQYVERPVNHQAQDLLSSRYTLSARIVAGDLRTDVNVPDDSTALSDSSQAKRDDVSGTFVSEVASIEGRDRRAPNERDGKHCVAYPLGLERGDGSGPDPAPRDVKPSNGRRDIDRVSARRPLHLG